MATLLHSVWVWFVLFFKKMDVCNETRSCVSVFIPISRIQVGKQLIFNLMSAYFEEILFKQEVKY